MPRQDYPANGIIGLLCSTLYGKGKTENCVLRNHGIAQGMHCTRYTFFFSFMKQLISSCSLNLKYLELPYTSGLD